jgi:transposase
LRFSKSASTSEDLPLRAGDTLILNNVGAHKVAGMRDLIEGAEARLEYLPPCSPEFNSVERTFAKLKAALRGAAARNISELWAAIPKAFARFSPDECRNDFTAAGTRMTLVFRADRVAL